MKKVIYFISCFFLMMNVALADEVTTFRCPSVASPGEVITCTIENDSYIGMKANYNFNGAFAYQGMEVNSPFTIYYHGSDGFVVGNVKDDSKLYLEFSVMVNKDIEPNQEYTISLEKIEFATVLGGYAELDNLSISIEILSDVNTLDSLEIRGGVLEPDFDKEVMDYQVIVDSDSTEITATLTDSNATIVGDIGEQKLVYGVNVFSIQVTSVRGNTRYYSIYVTRPIKDNDITLKRLELSSGTIEFQKDKFLYEVDVAYEIDKIDVIAEPTSKTSTVYIEKPDELIVGDNLIQVFVTAEDGSVGTYTIVVHRARKLSSDATIKSLHIKGYDLNFSPNNYAYQLEIKNEDKLDIDIVLNDSNAKYQVSGNDNLQTGSVIKIEVTAEDGTIQNYVIGITKKQLSSNTTIKSLNIKGYDLNFNPSNYAYSLEIGNEDSLDITVVLSDSNATYRINGNSNLQTGSVIKIVVMAEDGSVGTYMIVIHRKLQLSNDVTIQKLIVKGYSLDFYSDIYDYQLKIVDEDSLDIEVVLNNEKATYEIVGNENLENNSVIKIVVTAEDGSVGTYTITVHKEVELSSDATIKSLKVTGYKLAFKANIYDYELEIKDEDNLDIEVVLNHEKATYEIIGNENLENNSVIIIKVTAEDNSQELYQIRILKSDEGNSSLVINNVKFVSFIVIVFVIIIVIGIKLWKNKLTKEKPKLDR